MYQKKIAAYIGLFVVLLLGYAVLRDSEWQGSTQLHTVMEVAATLLAAVVGVMALLRFYSKRENTFLFIGCGFMGTAFLDAYHAIVTSAFFAQSFPSPPPSLIPWSWTASRLFLSIFLWLSWLMWKREQRTDKDHLIFDGRVYLVAVSLMVISFVFFAFVPLPRAYYPELFFYRPGELLPAAFFLLALVGYLRKGLWKTNDFEHWMVLALIAGFMGQVMFMSFSHQLFDSMFDAAHMLKKLSYIFVLIGLLISMYTLYRWADEANNKLGRNARELARSNIELEQFAYVASHDLQEPLRMVTSYMQLLEKRYKDRLDADANEFIGYAVDGAARMKELINDLLTYSRVVRLGKELTLIDSDKVLKDALANLSGVTEAEHAEVSHDPMPIVLGDATQLMQLFQNLIGNAIKFHGSDSPEIHIGVRTETNAHTFSVRDNGIGIAAEFHERIFSVFQRLHDNKSYEGTGIGLALCKKIVERHGGRIWLESQLGKGAIFHFTLSREKAGYDE